MTRITLAPGITLTAVQSDKFKTGGFSVNLLRPLCRKEASRNALTFSVLLRGTEQYPDLQSLSAAMDELYGAEIGLLVRKKGEVQAVGLYADYIEDDLLDGEPVFERVVGLVAQLLLQPRLKDGVFLEEYVEREKENLIHSIRSRINSKRSYAMGQMIKTMFPTEAYGTDRLGEEEDVQPITADSLYGHYQGLLETSRVEICYMGRKEPQHVAQVFQSAFASMPRGEMMPVSTVFVEKADHVKYKDEALAVTQGKLCMGFRTGCRGGDAMWPAMQVFNCVFGSGVTSKLFVNVREKMSLCYYASSSLERFKGIMAVSSGIEFDHAQTAQEAILQQLEDCRLGKISQYELDSAKKQLISGLKTAKDSPGQMDEFYLGQAISGETVTLDEIMESYAQVSVEQVAQAAQLVSLDTVYFLRGTEI